MLFSICYAIMFLGNCVNESYDLTKFSPWPHSAPYKIPIFSSPHCENFEDWFRAEADRRKAKDKQSMSILICDINKSCKLVVVIVVSIKNRTNAC